MLLISHGETMIITKRQQQGISQIFVGLTYVVIIISSFTENLQPPVVCTGKTFHLAVL